jgi:cytoskeleton protein RodZ
MTSNENDQQPLVAATTVPEVASEAIVVDGAASDSLQVSATQAIAGAAEMETELPTALPGELLAARRNELRWTLQEVSQRLKLAPRQITALEVNDFASLPGMASVRGFIRSYARLLELDPVPLLEMLSNEPNPAVDPILLRRPLPSRGFPGRRYAPPSGHRRGSRRLSGLALLVMVFVGALAYAAYRHGLPTINIDVPSVSTVFGSWKDLTEPTPNEATDQPVSAPEVATVDEQKSIDPSRLLELKLREDAWVEISALNGNKLVSRLMKAGTTEQFDISEPVILVIGNASGVDANLRGQPLNLRAVARDNVSKLSLK